MRSVSDCDTFDAMPEHPQPVFRTSEEVSLIGTMAIYDSQAEASEQIPLQWQAFLLNNPTLATSSKLYGASPCTGDRKIHYLAGVSQEATNRATVGEHLTLEAGEYAVVRVDETALLRDTWIWLLRSWLPASGRREEKRAGIRAVIPGSQKTEYPLGRSRSGSLSNHLQ